MDHTCIFLGRQIVAIQSGEKHWDKTYCIRLVDFVLLRHCKTIVLVKDDRSDIYFLIIFDESARKWNR